MSGSRRTDFVAPTLQPFRFVIGTIVARAAGSFASLDCACLHPFLGEPAMLEDSCIIQMNIDRYRAMLDRPLAGEERTRVQQLLAEADCQFSDAIRQLARAIDPSHQ